MRLVILGEATVTHTRRWVRYFVERGHDCRWFSFVDAPPVAELAPEPIPARLGHRGLSIPLGARSLRQSLSAWRPDLIAALFIPDYGWLASLVGIHPFAVAAWGSDVLLNPRKSFWHRRRIVRVLRSADLIFGDAECIADAMRDLGAPADRICTVPVGVDADWLQLERATNDWSTRPIRIVHNRQMKPLYRVADVIDAARHLHADAPGRFRLDIIGQGPLQSHLRSLAGPLLREKVISFHPHLERAELQARLAAADLYVSASESDGTSVSLLEAMAAGCIPIVSDIPANCEWIAHRRNGYLFPVGDSRALADRCLEAIADPSGVGAIVECNRDTIRQRALFTDNMRSVEESMQALVSAGASPPPGDSR